MRGRQDRLLREVTGEVAGLEATIATFLGAWMSIAAVIAHALAVVTS